MRANSRTRCISLPNWSWRERNAVPRSNPSVPMATFQPLWTPPTTRSALARRAGEEDLVELGRARQLLQRLHVDAGLAHGAEQERQPLVLRRVRVGAAHDEAPVGVMRARVVHTFWPLITHSSPSRTARVLMLARSEPAPGSLKPWHHSSVACRMPGQEAGLLLVEGDDRRPQQALAEEAHPRRRRAPGRTPR